MSIFSYRHSLCASAAAVALAFAITPAAAHAQAQAVFQFDQPAQPMADALRAIGAKVGMSIAFNPDIARGRTAPAVKGSYSAEQAIEAALAGSRLQLRPGAGGGFIVEAASTGERDAGQGPAEASAGADWDDREIVVTGSRVKGGVTASRLFTATQEEMRESGQANLGEFIRSLPQNFNGGQNPGVIPGGGVPHQNITGGSSLDLRGLGTDATLTLLNGSRLSFNGPYQAVDISAIPLAAVDRVEVVTDGASAVYGSDAVAGVANVILKRDFQGLETTARVGFTSEGGGFQQQYSGVGGFQWASGGLIATINYEDADPIFAHQRDYLLYLPRPYMLVPESRKYNGVMSVHFNLASNISLSVDALYNNNKQATAYNSTLLSETYTENESVTLSPKLVFATDFGWDITAFGAYGEDTADMKSTLSYIGQQPYHDSKSAFKNKSRTVEISGEGPLFSAPGGDARLAVGAGYRNTEFHWIAYRPNPASYGGEQSTRYVFGEISLPIVSPAGRSRFAERLVLNAALRHERYNDWGALTTPKVGVSYKPTRDIETKFSWGRSFKAPKLDEVYQPFNAYLEGANRHGAGYPPNSTFFALQGGNTGLKAEKATTRMGSIVVTPSAAAGLRIEVSYFNIKYNGRVLKPVQFINPLGDPSSADFILLNPTAQQLSEYLSLDKDGWQNNVGIPYDPANVIAIIDNRFVNVARQKIEGADFTIDYSPEAWDRSVSFQANATWLDIKQRNTTQSPHRARAGVLYTPPHWKARAGIIWRGSQLTASVFANYIGSVKNNRSAIVQEIGSMTTFDFTTMFRFGAHSGLFKGMELSASVMNLSNEKPPLLVVSSPYSANFDSANYSAVGRIINLTIRKRW